MSNPKIKYETQVKICSIAGPIAAGTPSEVASFNLSTSFKKAIGVKIIAIDNATLTQFDVALEHAELTQRDPIDSRDWSIPNAAKYIDTFKPLDISAGGTAIKVKIVSTLQAIPNGQTLTFQAIFLLTNDAV